MNAMHRYRISEGLREYYKRKNGGESMRTCEVEGCTKKHKAHGYCSKHAQRVLRHGNPDTVKPRGRWHLDDPPSVIPVGWVPPDAGQPMPFSGTVRRYLGILEDRDARMDAYSDAEFARSYGQRL
jgi:hypothetical protein